jgi:putative oxidoreductase
MLRSLMATEDRFAPTLARLTLGIVFFPHGMQKLFGWFGGYGFNGTLHSFTDQAHIPVVFAVLAILAEGLGSLGLIFGFLTRVAAFGIACNMTVAVYLVHRYNGFFMNWTGQQKGEGFEFHILALGLALFVMIYGGGAWSVDLAISKKQSAAALEHARA